MNLCDQEKFEKTYFIVKKTWFLKKKTFPWGLRIEYPTYIVIESLIFEVIGTLI